MHYPLGHCCEGDSDRYDQNVFLFQEFVVPITDEFVEHLYDGALSINVFGHHMEEGRSLPGRSLADRWSEVSDFPFSLSVHPEPVSIDFCQDDKPLHTVEWRMVCMFLGRYRGVFVLIYSMFLTAIHLSLE